MKRCLILLVLLFSSCRQAALHEESVGYGAGDTALKGFLVWDDAKGDKQPGVLVVHEWWGGALKAINDCLSSAQIVIKSSSKC